MFDIDAEFTFGRCPLVRIYVAPSTSLTATDWPRAGAPLPAATTCPRVHRAAVPTRVLRELTSQPIVTHYAGSAEVSTQRKTLGCLLAAELGIRLRRVGSDSRRTFVDGDHQLSQWMGEHAFAWESTPPRSASEFDVA
jgi:hypothetical protein